MGATGKRDVKHRVTLIKIGQNAPFRANFGQGPILVQAMQILDFEKSLFLQKNKEENG